jgi:CubicO group peptidase (beta-lactamase class C family)
MKVHRHLPLLSCALLFAAPSAAQVTRPGAIQIRPVGVDSLQVRAALARPEIAAAIRSGGWGVALDTRAVESHVMRPAHIVAAIGDDGPRMAGRAPSAATVRPVDSLRVESILSTPGLVFQRPDRRIRVVPSTTPRLDVNAFGAAVHEALKDSVASYMLQLRQNGQTVLNLQWNWARVPQDGGLGWGGERRMHVASVSKLITAMAMVRVLHEQGVSVDAPIVGYLPAYWMVGPNVGQITFRHLLTHRSGIRAPGRATDYWTMRGVVQNGVQASLIDGSCADGLCYQNANFALMRILIPVLNGANRQFMGATPVPMGPAPALIDQLWDVFSVASYADYVAKKVFQPAGVSGPRLETMPVDALAYRFPVVNPGWNSGNLRSVAGGAGWVMSVEEVLRVMNAYRRGGGIVPSAVAEQALDARFGIDLREQTAAGWLYNKNGRWSSGATPAEWRSEQSLAYFLPQNMELVVFTNSPIGRGNVFFRDLITNIYKNNLK